MKSRCLLDKVRHLNFSGVHLIEWGSLKKGESHASIGVVARDDGDNLV